MAYVLVQHKIGEVVGVRLDLQRRRREAQAARLERAGRYSGT